MTIDGSATQASLTEQVAEEIRALLGRKRMSGRELARRLDASPSWVNFRLTGAQPIDLNELARIAAVLGVGVADLMPRVVVHSGSPGAQPTVPKLGLTDRPHLFGHPKRTSHVASTVRTARLIPVHA